MFCSRCGVQLSGTGIFCHTCGNRLVPAAAQTENIAPVSDGVAPENAPAAEIADTGGVSVNASNAPNVPNTSNAPNVPESDKPPEIVVNIAPDIPIVTATPVIPEAPVIPETPAIPPVPAASAAHESKKSKKEKNKSKKDKDKEKLYFGLPALIFCLVIIGMLSVACGILAMLYF